MLPILWYCIIRARVLKHTKEKPKSFRSRNIQGKDRKALAESVADMAFPSKIYQRRLAALNENLFKWVT